MVASASSSVGEGDGFEEDEPPCPRDGFSPVESVPPEGRLLSEPEESVEPEEPEEPEEPDEPEDGDWESEGER